MSAVEPRSISSQSPHPSEIGAQPQRQGSLHWDQNFRKLFKLDATNMIPSSECVVSQFHEYIKGVLYLRLISNLCRGVMTFGRVLCNSVQTNETPAPVTLSRRWSRDVKSKLSQSSEEHYNSSTRQRVIPNKFLNNVDSMCNSIGDIY
jgi:hypothetical protein